MCVLNEQKLVFKFEICISKGENQILSLLIQYTNYIFEQVNHQFNVLLQIDDKVHGRKF